MPDMPEAAHPHAGTRVLSQGSRLENAGSALILLHGRGASAGDILTLAEEFDLPQDMIILAPQARGGVWYPQRFTASPEANEPFLSSALRRIDEVVAQLRMNSIPEARVMIGGFSQGACLAIEYAIQRGGRWGGLLGFSGGYIGPMGARRERAGSLSGTPAFLGCSDLDPHIPLQRVFDTSALLGEMGASVTTQIYPNMGHTINQDEIQHAQRMISGLS